MSEMTSRFGPVMTAMVTPFGTDGGLDVAAAAALARWLVEEQANDALVVAGTTGEAPTLSDAEKVELWRAVAGAVSVPVLAGTGSADTRHTVELTRQAAECGAAGVLVVTPYYNRPSQAGLNAHFRAVAGATNLPVVLYDIPVRTGRKIGHDTLLRLAGDVPNIVGVKDAALDVAGTARLVAEAPPGFEVYSGADDLTLALAALGARGVIGVATHWTGRLHAEMFTALAKGDLDGAREINARLIASFAYESTEAAPNPVPTKVLLRELGLPVGRCRPPLDDEPPEVVARARAVLAGLGDAAPAPYRP